MTATELLDTLWPYLAVAVPFLVGLVQSPQQGKLLKFGLSVTFSAAVTIITLAGMDWSTFDLATVGERLFGVIGIAQTAYMMMDRAMEQFFGKDLNDTLTRRPVQPYPTAGS